MNSYSPEPFTREPKKPKGLCSCLVIPGHNNPPNQPSVFVDQLADRAGCTRDLLLVPPLLGLFVSDARVRTSESLSSTLTPLIMPPSATLAIRVAHAWLRVYAHYWILHPPFCRARAFAAPLSSISRVALLVYVHGCLPSTIRVSYSMCHAVPACGASLTFLGATQEGDADGAYASIQISPLSTACAVLAANVMVWVPFACTASFFANFLCQCSTLLCVHAYRPSPVFVPPEDMDPAPQISSSMCPHTFIEPQIHAPFSDLRIRIRVSCSRSSRHPRTACLISSAAAEWIDGTRTKRMGKALLDRENSTVFASRWVWYS
ncbi:hypothetical protein B0H19DRAFT_1369006 [Mycena capillaripes]|nr:hypothetical protein B0H19DRAFT_1369006 [Mycena capillaripes]